MEKTNENTDRSIILDSGVGYYYSKQLVKVFGFPAIH